MALAYREASKELSKNGKPNISWVATKVTRVDGQHPSPQSVFEFFSKVDADPDKLCLGQGARLPAAVAVGPGAPNGSNNLQRNGLQRVVGRQFLLLSWAGR